MKLAFKIASVRFDWGISVRRDSVRFHRISYDARDPMTLRANMAAYRPVWRNEKVVAELLLDRGAWPGSSGSPVLRSDSRVIGMVIGSVTEEGTTITTVRCALAVRGLFADPDVKRSRTARTPQSSCLICCKYGVPESGRLLSGAQKDRGSRCSSGGTSNPRSSFARSVGASGFADHTSV